MKINYFAFLAVLIGSIFFFGCERLHKEVLPLKVLTIDNVSLSQKTFNPSKNEVVRLKYRLSQPAYVTVNIYISDNHWINTLIQDKYQPAGYNTITWDGKDIERKFLPDEAYIYTIEAKNQKTNENFLYDLADSNSGFELKEMQGEFDKDTGQISYVLPKAARVRIRLGIAKGPLLNNLLHWQPQEAGRHSLFWDGKDNSGRFDFSKHPDLRIFFTSFSLPDNCIIIQGNTQSFVSYKLPSGGEYRVKKEQPVQLSLYHQQHRHSHHPKEDSPNQTQPPINSHKNHTRSQCQEPQLQINFVDQPQSEIPLLKGKVPVRISIVDKDRTRLIKERFGIAIFIDYIFFYEDLDAITPYTYYLDTTHLNSGKHVLSVSIESYEDHIGIESMLIDVKHDEHAS